MHFRILTLAALAGSLAAALQASASEVKNSLRGDYVEARTANVFIGACHYGGEATTAGREAELVWNVREGSWNGVDLRGVKAMAAVTADRNLSEPACARRTVLYIDTKASAHQADALVCALNTRCRLPLGTVLEVKRTPISFERNASGYRVEVGNVSRLTVEPMPNRECCKQPHLIWYEPFVPLTGRRVGFTRLSGVKERALGSAWSFTGQNSAFYGQFSL